MGFQDACLGLMEGIELIRPAFPQDPIAGSQVKAQRRLQFLFVHNRSADGDIDS